jgi:hypothetical protein
MRYKFNEILGLELSTSIIGLLGVDNKKNERKGDFPNDWKISYWAPLLKDSTPSQ